MARASNVGSLGAKAGMMLSDGGYLKRKLNRKFNEVAMPGYKEGAELGDKVQEAPRRIYRTVKSTVKKARGAVRGFIRGVTD